MNPILKNTECLFKELAEKDVICQNCYQLWKNKDIALEQSLNLAFKGVIDYCNHLIGFVPSENSVILREYLDYLSKLEGSLIWQLYYLVEYSAKLIKIAMYYHERRPVSITIPKEGYPEYLLPNP